MGSHSSSDEKPSFWTRAGLWTLKVIIMSSIVSCIIIGYFQFFRPCDRLMVCSQNTVEKGDIIQAATYAIDHAQQSVVLLEWFIITLMSLFAGVVAYLIVSQINANKELVRMRSQAQEINGLVHEWRKQIGVMNRILGIMPRRILSHDLVDTFLERGGDPNSADRAEAIQWQQWQKWTIMGDESGYISLKEIGPDQLSKNVKFVIFMEIEEIKGQIGDQSDFIPHEELNQRLEKLRSLITI
jgi:hypothetical protein